MLRQRKTKIIATLGPSSSTYERIRGLHMAGADVFRLNFSHGTHENHQKTFDIIRQIESELGAPICILGDLQGPKLRIGTFQESGIHLNAGDTFILDQDPTHGDISRVCLPHAEIFAALVQESTAENSPPFSTDLLLDDGKIRLKVLSVSAKQIITQVLTGGHLSNRKGVNVPGVMLPLSALTEKDQRDLEFALDLGVDWIALSFVQHPDDVSRVQTIINGRTKGHAKIISKIEKPQALSHLAEIIHLSDGIMIARGDLGVEMNPEDVPTTQKRIIRECRELGKPVIVATQMLESMIHAPSPTRAEASDVATAVYDSVDAVMLSAESASGDYPLEAVSIMHRIITQVESDPLYGSLAGRHLRLSILPTVSDAMTVASRQVAHTISVKAIVTFTETGRSTLRETRERPKTTIIGLTPKIEVARMMGLFWGTHPVVIDPISSFTEMVNTACAKVKEQKVAEKGDCIIILAGVPFGQRSGTNIMRVIDVE